MTMKLLTKITYSKFILGGLILLLSLFMLNLADAFTANTLTIQNNTYTFDTGFNGGAFYTDIQPWEYCTNITTNQTMKLAVTFRVDYTGTYNVDNYATVRIRDSSSNLLEEINDTDKNGFEQTSNYYAAGTYGICIRDNSGSYASKMYSQTAYPGYTINGSYTTAYPSISLTIPIYTTENLTLTGAGVTRWLSVPSAAGNFTSAYMNLSAINFLEDLIVDDYSCSYDNFCGYGNDSDWSTAAVSNNVADGDKNVTLNFSYSPKGIVSNITFNFKSSYGRNAGAGWFGYNKYYYWNYTSNNWQFFIYSNCLTSLDDRAYVSNLFCNASLPLDSTNGTYKIITRGSSYASATGSMNERFYEGNITINYRGLNNVSLSINNTNLWNYTGYFNQINNKTNNLASIMNSYLVPYYLVGENYYFPLTFNISGLFGLLQYSALEFNWTEYIPPNLTIYDPNQTYTGYTFIPINFSAVDNWMMDTCYYNVTRGASLEIANTYINCSTNASFVVSGDASYVFHMCVNDTSGNQNCSRTSFKTVGYVPYVPPAPPGGGGGGGTIIEQLTKTVTSNICDATYPPFKVAWASFNENKSWANFKEVWYSFWNYALCNNAASIIPLQVTTQENVTG